MYIMRHLENIGLHKGLVFKEATRKKLIAEQKSEKAKFTIEWKEKHYWN